MRFVLIFGTPYLFLVPQVILDLEITKGLALKVDKNWTVELIKALIQDKEQLGNEHSQQLSFGGRPLENVWNARSRHNPCHKDLAKMTINVQMLSTQKNLLVKTRNRITSKMLNR